VYDSGTIRVTINSVSSSLSGWQGICCVFLKMPKTILHVERKSRFLRALVPINPCEDIRFGVIDYLSIGFFLVCFLGLIFTLAG
jgi:hypothetical protein